MIKKNDTAIGYVLATIAGIFWGTIGIFGSIIMDSGAPPGMIGVFRLGIGACILGCIMLALDRKLFWPGWKGVLSISLVGLISQSAMNFTYFRAISMTTPSTAVVLLYTCPVFLLIYGTCVYKERLTLRKVLAAVLCISGCYMMATQGDAANLSLNATGLLYGLGSGISYALVTICSKELLKHYNTITILFYGFIAGTVGLALLASPVNLGVINWNIKTLLAMGGLGLFSGALAYLCYVGGLSRGVEASKAGILSSLEVVSGVILSFIVLNEDVNRYKILGTALVFISILLVNQSEPVKDRKKRSEEIECKNAVS